MKEPTITHKELRIFLLERIEVHQKGRTPCPIKYEGRVSINAVRGAVAELEQLIEQFERREL